MAAFGLMVGQILRLSIPESTHTVYIRNEKKVTSIKSKGSY